VTEFRDRRAQPRHNDGCSARLQDSSAILLFLNPIDTCDVTVTEDTDLWAAAGCKCIEWQPCMCVEGPPPSSSPTATSHPSTSIQPSSEPPSSEPSPESATWSYTSVTSETCEYHGHQTLYDEAACKAAAAAVGINFIWGPYGGWDVVVDGCSARIQDSSAILLFLNPIDTCDVTVTEDTDPWAAAGCKCIEWQPCMCLEGPPPSSSPTSTSHPSSSPTISPTPVPCASDETTFELDLYTDDYGYETSWQLTNVLSGSLMNYGPEAYSSYGSNVHYHIQECLPCGGYNFTIVDSYGDGFGEGGGYTVTVDGEVLQSGPNLFYTSETTLLSKGSHFTSCPPPMRIMLNHEVGDSQKYCIQPEGDFNSAPIVVRPCNNSSLQRWTVDWMGQHHNFLSKNRCIKKKGTDILFLPCATNSFPKNLVSNFVMNQYHGTLLWMKDNRMALSFTEDKNVKLMEFIRPDDPEASKQQWIIDYTELFD